jgi:chemotaxis response regulator CheB
VVLSGGGSDGTVGIGAIKEAGGFTLAHGPDSPDPVQPSMPAKAIAAGLVDVVAWFNSPTAVRRRAVWPNTTSWRPRLNRSMKPNL